MNNILKQLSLLYEQELYSNIVRLGELAVSLCDQKQDLVVPFVKLQIYVYYAEALYNMQQYLTAESIYTQALQIRKYIIKTKNTSKMLENEKELLNDVDIKYKIHLCCVKLKQNQKAAEVLQSISARLRTPKINMALGNMYRDSGMERSAIACYKEVLRESPLAMEAAENLLKLGVEGVEVNSLMLGATSDIGWASTWLRGQAQMYSRDYSNALTTFRSLDINGLLRDSSTMLVNTGYCYYLMGNEERAISYLLRAVRVNHHLQHGRDLLASILANSKDKEHLRELERLLTPDLHTSLWPCEYWVVFGYHMYANKKYDRAACYGQQALMLNKRNVDALLLKSSTFMQINKYQEALMHYREAVGYSSHRFDAHKGLVHCYLAMNRLREATTVANNACKQLNQSPAALTLYASVLIKDPMNVARARSLLERSIANDPGYSPAVWLLIEHLDQEGFHEEAVGYLMRHAEHRSSSRLHQVVGDCFVKLQKDNEAFEHYHIALRIDPNNQRALEGLNNLGKSPSSVKLDSSYYVSVGSESSAYTSQAPATSDHEPDSGSDTDQWPSGNDLIAFD